RGPSWATRMGLPHSSGWSSCSMAAKKASMSAWTITRGQRDMAKFYPLRPTFVGPGYDGRDGNATGDRGAPPRAALPGAGMADARGGGGLALVLPDRLRAEARPRSDVGAGDGPLAGDGGRPRHRRGGRLVPALRAGKARRAR